MQPLNTEPDLEIHIQDMSLHVHLHLQIAYDEGTL